MAHDAESLRMPPVPLTAGTELTVADVPNPSFPPGSRVRVVADCRQGGVLVAGRLADGRDEQELCAWEEFEGLTDERHD